MDKKHILSLFVLGLLLAGCTTNQGGNSSGDTITIGSIGILTGEGASWGVAARNGVDLAVADINAQGGIEGRLLRAIHEDDQGDTKKALSAYQKLTQFDGISLIIGTTWSNTGLTLVESAARDGVLMISPSLGKSEFNEGSEYLFNTWPHDFILSANLADYVYEKGHRRVALIGAQQIWVKDQTNAFKERFEELGGTVDVLVEPLPDSKEVTTDALKIREADADAIISTTDGILVGSLVAKRVRELGVDLPMYSITIDADAISTADGAYEGMEFLTFLTPTPSFEGRYREEYGINLDIGADSAYDAVMLLAQAMRETGSTEPEALQAYLNGVETYSGVSGTLVSDGLGGFTKPFVVKRVENGEIVDIQ